MTQLSNLPCGMTESSIPWNSPADEAINRLIDALCDICKSEQPICPVNDDAVLCPHNVIEKAEYEYYHGDD